MTRLSAGKARESFADVLNRVANRRERIILNTRGKDIAVLISIEDMRLFEKLIENIEDHLDIKAAKQAWIEQGDEPPASWKEVKARLRGARIRGA